MRFTAILTAVAIAAVTATPALAYFGDDVSRPLDGRALNTGGDVFASRLLRRAGSSGQGTAGSSVLYRQGRVKFENERYVDKDVVEGAIGNAFSKNPSKGEREAFEQQQKKLEQPSKYQTTLRPGQWSGPY